MAPLTVALTLCFESVGKDRELTRRHFFFLLIKRSIYSNPHPRFKFYFNLELLASPKMHL